MSADASRLIGHGLCPACRKPGARWSVMRTGRVCITHNGCCQLMSRGDDSDELLRERRMPGGDLHDPEDPLPAEPPPAVVHPPAPPAAAPTAPPAAPRKPSWGIGAW